MITVEELSKNLHTGRLVYETDAYDVSKSIVANAEYNGKSYELRFIVKFGVFEYYDGFDLETAVNVYNNIQIQPLYIVKRHVVINSRYGNVECALVKDLLTMSSDFNEYLLKMNRKDMLSFMQHFGFNDIVDIIMKSPETYFYENDCGDGEVDYIELDCKAHIYTMENL